MAPRRCRKRVLVGPRFILTMESTSVFQRLKTMKMLNSMGTKSYGIMVSPDQVCGGASESVIRQVFRGGSWVEKSLALGPAKTSVTERVSRSINKVRVGS